MTLRIRIVGVAAVLLTAGLAVYAADRFMTRQFRASCYQRAEDVPPHRVALLLGTGKWLRSGIENPMYRYRIEAAARLWHAGRVDYILASGDNGRRDYDEPSAMTIDLVDAGVPFDAIYRDYAGFRTLDSVVRAKKVFGLSEFVIVSQPFHNERALYLAHAAGIRAVGYNARDVAYAYALKTRVREKFARLAAVLDVNLLHTKPRFLGTPVEIGASHSSDASSTAF
jgi:SanA protein